MPSDRFGQYAQDGGGAPDPLEQRRIAASQYTTSPQGQFSPPPPVWEWRMPQRPTSSARALNFFHAASGAPPAGESLPTPSMRGRRRFQLDVEEPPPEQPGQEPGTPGQPEGQPTAGPGGQGAPGSFGSPEDFAKATDGGSGGNMSSVLGGARQAGLLAEELF
jgi:hypothetical protein